jgi:transposase-like protein
VKDDDTEVGGFRDVGRFSNSEIQRFSLSGVAEGKSHFRIGTMMCPVCSRKYLFLNIGVRETNHQRILEARKVANPDL